MKHTLRSIVQTISYNSYAVVLCYFWHLCPVFVRCGTRNETNINKYSAVDPIQDILISRVLRIINTQFKQNYSKYWTCWNRSRQKGLSNVFNLSHAKILHSHIAEIRYITHLAARWSGVDPSMLTTATLAPKSRSILTMKTLLYWAA